MVAGALETVEVTAPPTATSQSGPGCQNRGPREQTLYPLHELLGYRVERGSSTAPRVLPKLVVRRQTGLTV